MTTVFGWNLRRMTIILFITLIVLNDQSGRGLFQVSLH
jgi:hypothetical protein